MSKRRISITFCGGCNPRIDRGKIAEQVRGILKASGYQVEYNSADVDFVIYMSGCTAGCAVRNNGRNSPSVAVAAATIDAVAIDAEKLVTEIVMKVRIYFEQLERDLSG